MDLRYWTAAVHEDGKVEFWQESYIESACAFIRLPAEIIEAFRLEAERVRNDLSLIAQASRLHQELFLERLPPKEANDRLLAADEGRGMLAALVYLGALPQMLRLYEKRGIAADIAADTMADLEIWMRRHKSMHGNWGLSQLGWLYRHVTAGLFRLGRLQFAPIASRLPIVVLRPKAGGDMITLAESGVRYRADGQADGTNGVYDPEDGWTSNYLFDGVFHCGSRISPEGEAMRETTRLPAADWEVALRRGDSVLDVHIPEGGKMSHELCQDSYARAYGFVRAHFPELDCKAFVCSSWLLSPQLGRLLPAESNIVRFQSDYDRVPERSDESQTLERVFGFGTKLDDLATFPRETSLQRTVYDYLAAGGRVHGAAGFMLFRDSGEGSRGTGSVHNDVAFGAS